MIRFARTKEISNMSQVKVTQSVGRVVNQDIDSGAILMSSFFVDNG